jgi:hypothetical protein
VTGGADQISLFEQSNGPAVIIPTTGARGPKGVLIALIEIGYLRTPLRTQRR